MIAEDDLPNPDDPLLLEKLEALENEMAEIYEKQPRKCVYCSKFADERCDHCESLVCYEHRSKQSPGNEIIDKITGERSICCYKCVSEFHALLSY